VDLAAQTDFFESLFVHLEMDLHCEIKEWEFKDISSEFYLGYYRFDLKKMNFR
jgi:hypothetical protein